MRKQGPAYRIKRSKRSLTLAEMWIKQDGRCKYCRRVTILDGSPDSELKATRDHVIPRAHNGKQANNQVMACARCNSAKGHMTVEAFRRDVLPHLMKEL